MREKELHVIRSKEFVKNYLNWCAQNGIDHPTKDPRKIIEDALRQYPNVQERVIAKKEGKVERVLVGMRWK